MTNETNAIERKNLQGNSNLISGLGLFLAEIEKGYKAISSGDDDYDWDDDIDVYGTLECTGGC